MKSVLFLIGLVVAISAAHAQDDFSHRMEEDRLRQSQQEALDNYNKQMQEQRQTQQTQQLQQLRTSQQAINFDTGRNFVLGVDQRNTVALGYAAGVFAVGQTERHICTHDNTTYVEMATTVYDYIKAHPSEIDTPLSITSTKAFVQKWPCPARK